MTLKRNSWIIRTFLFSERMKSGFHGWSRHQIAEEIENLEQTNLCYMVRSIALYLPFMVLMQLATLGMILEAAIFYPMSRVGWRWWLVPAWVIGIVVVVVLLILGICLLWDRPHSEQPPTGPDPYADGSWYHQGMDHEDVVIKEAEMEPHLGDDINADDPENQA